MADTSDSITVRITADTSAVRDALARVGARLAPPRDASGELAAFEKAFARVEALSAATAEHMNALADLVQAGFQPWQMRYLAGALSSPVGVVPTTVPRGRHV